MPKSTVLVISDNTEELMQIISALEHKYTIVDIDSNEDYVAKTIALCVDLILLDDMIFEPNCYDICQLLKADITTQRIPVLLMSDLNKNELEREVDYLGADDYIAKPINNDELFKKVATILAFSGLSQ